MRTRLSSVGSLLVAASLLAACGGRATATQPGAAPAAQESGATPVVVAKVERTTVSQTLSFTGDVKALSEVGVVPKQAGTILTMPVAVGSTVHAGDVIAQLDDTQLRLALRQQEASLEQAQAKLAAERAGPRPESVAQAQIAVQVAQSKLQALLDGPRPENVASARAALASAQAAAVQAQQSLLLAQRPNTREDVDQARLAVQNAQQQLIAAQKPYTDQDIQQAQASVDQAKQNVQDATVRAPVDGVVTAKGVSEGALVTTGSALVTIASKAVDVEVTVPEDQVAGIAAGKPAQIAAALGGASLDGTVTSVAPSADSKSRAFVVKVAPASAAESLRPGTFASVTIAAAEHRDVAAVPSAAIVQRGGKNVVFVVSGGIAKETPVTVGLSNATLTEVSGVDVPAEVVVHGPDNLADGGRVTVTSA